MHITRRVFIAYRHATADEHQTRAGT